MKKLIFAIMCCLASMMASAQIGYQVSLLNNATGEPRANERVTVTVKIIDTYNNVLCNETKTVTTNDFGVISLKVGNKDTFANADWNKLPFWIEATVDNRLIGQSQILAVPVAEYAKHTGTLTKEHLCSKTWLADDYDENCAEIYTYNFAEAGDYEQCYYTRSGLVSNSPGRYEIVGNDVFLFEEVGFGSTLKYDELSDCLFGSGRVYK